MKVKVAKGSGKKRWMLDVGTINGERQRVFFETEAQAVTSMKQPKKLVAVQGRQALALPVGKRLEYQSAEERLQKIGWTLNSLAVWQYSYGEQLPK